VLTLVTLDERLREITLTPQQVQEATGLTARQINLWHKKGAVNPDRDSPLGWRRFSPYQLFILKLCADLRKLYGVDLSFLNWLVERLDKPQNALVTMSSFIEWLEGGFSVTALIIPRQRRAWLEPESIHINRIAERLKDPSDLDSIILHRLDDLIKTTIEFCLDDTAPIKVDAEKAKLFEVLFRKSMALSANEAEVIRLMRIKQNQQITLKLENGQPISGTISQTLKGAKPSEAIRFLQEHEYQNIHLKRGTNGVSMSRDIQLKSKSGKLQ
jgi:DNA-binding transcriptional MerR regulator